jgi:hypothetical protein
MQTLGASPLGGWDIREPSIRNGARLVPQIANPWSGRVQPIRSAPQLVHWALFPVTVASRINSGFPFGGNDGAMWAGRGVTVAADFGGIISAGPVVLQLNPVVFWAQNASFPLQQNGLTGEGAFRAGQPQYATSIDLPQRFGDGAYARADIGDTELRVELPWFMAGVSNAHRVWGPAAEYPFILGVNAPGFLHAFVSTNDPVNIGIAMLRANVLWAKLDQSDYSPVSGSPTYYSIGEPGTKRYATGLAVSFQPHGLPNLEIGVTRFIQSVWPRQGLPRSYATKAFQNFLKKSLGERDAKDASDLEGSDNQLLSAFVRWVLPHSGAELYMEYGRDDHAYDFRDLVNEPDHSRSYMLGARKVISSSPTYMSAIRGELMNYQLPTTVRHRDEGGIYLHGLVRQGHTQRGQMLGAPLGPGAAAGSTVAYDRYDPAGRLTVAWTRTVNQEAGLFYRTGVQSRSSMDVTHSLSVERLLFRGPLDITAGGTFSREFSRNFSSDALNVSAVLGARYNIR